MGGEPFDQTVLDWIVPRRTPWLTDVVTAITHLGDTVVAVAITTVVTVLLLVRRRPVEAVTVAGAMIGGYLLMSGSKLVFARPRPPLPVRLVDEATYSFPSGHAMMSMVLVCVLGFAAVRVLGARLPLLAAGLALWTIAIGLSRVYLAAHWATDVLAGWTVGALWAALWIVGVDRIVRWRTNNSGDSGAAPGRTL